MFEYFMLRIGRLPTNKTTTTKETTIKNKSCGFCKGYNERQAFPDNNDCMKKNARQSKEKYDGYQIN